MQRASTAKGPDPATIYVAWQAFCVALPDGTSPVIAQGSRLRCDDPAVQAAPFNFLPDGSGPQAQAEAAEAYAARNPLPAPEPNFRPPPPPLRDEDAAVAIRRVSTMNGDRSGTGQLEQAPLVVEAGERLPKDHPIVKQNDSAFRPVVPGKLARADALKAKVTMLMTDGRGMDAIGVYGTGETDEHIVYAGTWVARDCPFVKLHLHHFEAPPPEPWA